MSRDVSLSLVGRNADRRFRSSGDVLSPGRLKRTRAGRAVLWLAMIAAAGCAAGGPKPTPTASATDDVKPLQPAFRVDDVLGKTAAEVDALFGDPRLTRREGRGEFRRYALDGCNVIAILYPDENDEPPARPIVASLYAGAKSAGALKPDLDACLARGL